jgi:hypothetical protein
MEPMVGATSDVTPLAGVGGDDGGPRVKDSSLWWAGKLILRQLGGGAIARAGPGVSVVATPLVAGLSSPGPGSANSSRGPGGTERNFTPSRPWVVADFWAARLPGTEHRFVSSGR